MIIALLDDGHIFTHLNDLLINRLVVEELHALVVNIGVCTLQNRGDNAAVTQGVIIGLGAAAEGICEEGLCQINIAAVGSDIQTATTVGSIALAAVQRRNGGDLPLAGVFGHSLHGGDDPVTLHNTGNHVTLNALVDVVAPAVRQIADVFLCHVNDCFADTVHRFILSDVRLTILELGNSLSLHHNVDQVAVIAAAGEQILASFGINIFTDFGNIGPSCTGHVIDSLTDLLQQIGAVCKDNSAVIHRHTVVNTVHDGVGNHPSQHRHLP